MLFDFVLAHARVLASSVGDTARAILVNLAGIGDGDDDSAGEGSSSEALFGQIGVVARPKPPSKDGHTEVIAARTEDGLQPLAHRDLRLNQRVNPKEGEVDVVQYGGGFLSLADNSEGTGTTAVLYTPQLAPDGSIKEAHALVFDTASANSSISLVHALGMALLMTKEEKIILKNKTGDAYVEIGPAGITLNGNVTLNGGMLCGDPVGAQPVVLAPALATYLQVLEAKANAAPGAPIPPGTLAAAITAFTATKASAR